MKTKLTTGVETTQKKINSNGIKAVRIEVKSDYYDLDPMYHQVTLDTEYEMWQKEYLTKLFKNMM